ncbi:hypothetical protein, conserved [Plasmodium gonderi]|uniref:Uncharacterized protein n=1 Tax=Plasmodium gonderi TaxID=77519 RepID=A0A1Y1JIP3_PLAGO|nr:hypothetical protein, conserved [Plasmodium gonderi]GAW79964.1 hypothetical protein, conserved [Plasmodium gonderi]
MELVIKKPYIEVFERILKLFTSVCENMHLRLMRDKLELIGSNNLTNELIMHLDKKFFSLNNVNCDEKCVSGSVNSKDLYNCLFSYQITKLLRNNGNFHLCGYEKGEKERRESKWENKKIDLDKKFDKVVNYSDAATSAPAHPPRHSNNPNEKLKLSVSKLILKFNNENNTLEVTIKFRKRSTHCSAVLKLKPFKNTLKNYVYKNESIIQVEPTLFLLNLKDLANERNIFLKNTDNSIIMSAIETSDFSLNKEKIKREQFFYNNKKISIPSSKTKYFFKNKKFEDHSLSLPLNELKIIFKFCSDLNLLCLFSTKNFKENVVICFGGMITHILQKNRKKILSHSCHSKGEEKLNHAETNEIHDRFFPKEEHIDRTSYIEQKEESMSSSCVFYLSDDSNSSDEYGSDIDEIDQVLYFQPKYEEEDFSNENNMQYNDIITGHIHFTSYFNVSCNFNDYTFSNEHGINNHFENSFFPETKVVSHSFRNGVNKDLYTKPEEPHKKNINAVINVNRKENTNIIYCNDDSTDRKNLYKGYQTPSKDVIHMGEKNEHCKAVSRLHMRNRIRDDDRGEDRDGGRDNDRDNGRDDISGVASEKDKEQHDLKKIEEKKHLNRSGKSDESYYEKSTHLKYCGKKKTGETYHDSTVEKTNDTKTPTNCDRRRETMNYKIGNAVEERMDFLGELSLEELNYDVFMRENRTERDYYANMESEIKGLQRTLENVNKIEQQNRRYASRKKRENEPLLFHFSDPDDNKMGREAGRARKRKKKRECHFADTHETSNKRRNNSIKKSNGLLLYSNNKHIRDDSRSYNSDSEISFNDNLCNSMASDCFYSLSEENDEMENVIAPLNNPNMEYENYFDNVYSKYHLYNNFKCFKKKTA